MPDQSEPLPPKSSLRQEDEKPYVEHMEARLAVLEQIAKDTKEALVEIRQDGREMRQEFRREFDNIRKDFENARKDFESVRKDARGDFRLLFGAIITVALGLAGLMARGFHWF